MDDPTRRCENDTGIETRLPGLPVPSGSPSFAAFTAARLGFSHWNSTPGDYRGEFFVNPLACTLVGSLELHSIEGDRPKRSAAN